MVAQGGASKDGKPFANGALFDLAEKSIYKITAADIRKAYDAAEAKSQRQAVYSMQVLRAVLNWHGIVVDDSPLSKQTAGKTRIKLAATAGDPRPIPAAKLGAWWTAASARSGHAGADGLRLILLTGCRPGEVFGSEYEPGLLAQDVDLVGDRLTLLDTKNRKDHTVMLSAQALEILRQHCEGKKPEAKVFDIAYVSKAIDAINVEAGVVGITPHKLRHTFASVAAKKCSVYELKAMMNHSTKGDVTAEHYVDVDESDLKIAWQKVADFICGAKAP
jgi:integrase